MAHSKATYQSPHPLDRETAQARLAHFSRRGQFSHYTFYRTVGFARQAIDGLSPAAREKVQMEIKVDGKWVPA